MSIRNSSGNGCGSSRKFRLFLKLWRSEKLTFTHPPLSSTLLFILSLSGRAILYAFFPPKPNALIFIFLLLIETIKKPC